MIFLTPFYAVAQDKTTDSLKLALKDAKHDTTRCNILFHLIESESNNELWPMYNGQLLKLVQSGLLSKPSSVVRRSFLKHKAYAINNMGVLANERGDIDSALVYYQAALKLQEEVNDKFGIAGSLNNIGFIYNHFGDIPKALDYYHKCLKISEELNNKTGIATVLNNLGLIYVAQKDIPRGVKYYTRSLKICEEIDDKEGMGSALNNIGAAYDCVNNMNMAFEYYKRSLILYTENRNKSGIATSLNNIGMIFHKRNKLDEALDYYQRALEIEESAEDLYSFAYTASNIAHIKWQQGKTDDAMKYAKESLSAALKLGYPDNISKPAEILKEIYKKQNDFLKAYEMYELEIKMKDSINNEETQKAAVKKQLQYAYEKKDAVAKAEHKSQLEKQQVIADEKQRKQTIVIWSVALGLIAVMVFAAYVFKTLSLTRKQKALIEVKSREVEEKQREILDSIHYARRIQRALIPTERYISKNLKRLQTKV